MTEHNLPERTFKVELDPDSIKRNPEEMSTALLWAGLDTAWKVLREYATRTAMCQIRDAADAKGVEWPRTDEEVFEAIKAKLEVDHVDYLTIAPGDTSKPMGPAVSAAGASLQSIVDILHHEVQHVLDELYDGELLAAIHPDEDEGDPIEGDGF